MARLDAGESTRAAARFALVCGVRIPIGSVLLWRLGSSGDSGVHFLPSTTNGVLVTESHGAGTGPPTSRATIQEGTRSTCPTTMQIQARLDELNASIDRQDADGKLLEQLVEDAATSIPSWELSRCWRYAAWPGRAGFELPSHDDGIDLVAEKTDGDLVAIQCKARSSGSVIPTHIQKFAGKANPRIFQERWFVATTELTSGNERALGECDVIWKNALIELRQIADERLITEGPDPRTAMQDEAVTDCIAVLRQPPSELAELWREQGAALGYLPANVGRAKLILPCGTGKTRVSMRIVNELCADGTLAVVLVPSIALIGQVRRAYLEGLECGQAPRASEHV